MSIATSSPKASARPNRLRVALAAIVGAALVALALDTTVVRVGSDADSRQQAFSPDRYGQAEFPRIQAFIRERAVDAPALAAAVLADKDGAAKTYGTQTSGGAVIPVRLLGTMGTAKSGIYDLAVEGLPPEIRVRVQTGPAINGTELRDAPGDIAFGQFKNQIEYQDAGSGINRAMKAAVLDPIAPSQLSGETVEVVGAFRLINPKNWLVTPVAVAVR